MDDQYRIPDSNSPANDQAADDAAPQANDDAAASASSAATDPIADAWTPVPAAGEQPPAPADQPTVEATPAASDPWNVPIQDAPAGYSASDAAPSSDGSATVDRRASSGCDAAPLRMMPGAAHLSAATRLQAPQAAMTA